MVIPQLALAERSACHQAPRVVIMRLARRQRLVVKLFSK